MSLLESIIFIKSHLYTHHKLKYYAYSSATTNIISHKSNQKNVNIQNSYSRPLLIFFKTRFLDSASTSVLLN